MDRVISFPHLGNYYIVFDYFIRKATKCKVILRMRLHCGCGLTAGSQQSISNIWKRGSHIYRFERLSR